MEGRRASAAQPLQFEWSLVLKGWGAQDDFQEQQKATIDEARERARVALEGQGRMHCEECGNVIPEARRKAMPNATMCVKCKEKHE